MIKNYYYLIVGILSIVFAFTHAWNGQTSFLPIINEFNIGLASKTTIFYVWHIITVENLVFGMAFLAMSIYKDLSKVKFTAWIIAIIMVARWIVIFGSTLFKNKDGIAETLIDSIAILVMVGLIILGTRKKKILAFLLLGTLSACTSTHITSSWKEPNKQLIINKLNKVLVVALFKNETSSHKAEDEMVRYLRGKGVVSYDYLNAKFNKQNEEAIRNKIRQDGFDGAITMRLLDVEQETNYPRGAFANYPPYYQSFSGYYFRNWGFYNNPNYYFSTKTYTVETNVYSIKEDKIIWTGLTETVNPDGVDKMIREISKVVYKTMIKEGFVKK